MVRFMDRLMLICEWLAYKSKVIEHRIKIQNAGDNILDFEEAKAKWGQGNV